MKIEKGYKAVVNEMKKFYLDWLSYSKLSEEQLCSYRTVKNFTINKEVYGNGFISVSMTYKNENEIKTIGEPFVSLDINKQTEFLINVTFLMLYIATKLDDKNLKEPIHGSYCDKYFYSKVKSFAGKQKLDQ